MKLRHIMILLAKFLKLLLLIIRIIEAVVMKLLMNAIQDNNLSLILFTLSLNNIMHNKSSRFDRLVKVKLFP